MLSVCENINVVEENNLNHSMSIGNQNSISTDCDELLAKILQEEFNKEFKLHRKKTKLNVNIDIKKQYEINEILIEEIDQTRDYTKNTTDHEDVEIINKNKHTKGFWRLPKRYTKDRDDFSLHIAKCERYKWDKHYI